MISRQFIRYAAIGLMLNVLLFSVYLLLTHGLMSSPAAMTATYSAGVLIGFALNRSITFSYQGRNSIALRRYVLIYVTGYALNFIVLWLLVGQVGVPHEIVQGGVTFTLPLLLFILQKYWVFRVHPVSGSSRCFGSVS
jgi:putative flippase GtrA